VENKGAARSVLLNGLPQEGRTMNVLITGGAGYLGSVLTPMLVEEGYDVTVLDNFIYRPHGTTSLANLCRFPNFRIERADVRDFAQVKPYLAKADAVIPLAALVGAPICNANPVDAELVNLKHPLELFANLSDQQLCVMPTTESAYGSNADVCTEETPINPLSTYAKHKAIVEDALMQRDNSISLRLATVYGMSPRMRLDLLVNDFSWKAYREGSILLFEHHFRRTVLHVRDAARAFMHALEYADSPLASMPKGIYNVGREHVTKLGLCDLLKRKLPKFYYTLMPIGGDPDQRDYEVSSAKLLRTGYEFSVTLDDGIDELLKGYRMLSNSVHGNV
jgi:nucleoside-diphosphate-sugar epimerase